MKRREPISKNQLATFPNSISFNNQRKEGRRGKRKRGHIGREGEGKTSEEREGKTNHNTSTSLKISPVASEVRLDG